MFAGKYNFAIRKKFNDDKYTVEKKFGSKLGTVTIDVDQEKQTLTGTIFWKNLEMPIRGKVDGHKIEFYGSNVGKLSTYIFCVGGYTNDDGDTFTGKMEDKRGAKEIYAVREK